jgi:uncharacterized damage-inducible protein DinB
VPEALLEAARTTLDGSLRELRTALDGLDADGLDARPAGPGSNSLSVIAVHALASTRSWLALATGAPLPPRDRPSEFETRVDDPTAFFVSVDATAEACRELLARADRIDLERIGTAPWRRGAAGEEPVSAAWALLHALDHLREHVGHAQLTRQLLDQG